MRTSLLSVILVLWTSIAASAQPVSRVDIIEGQSRAGMQPVNTPYATGGPWAAVPARALKPEVAPTAVDFRIRAWTEGERARVLVFAVTREAGSPAESDDERETQIASVVLSSGQSMQIAATDKYNARPITLRALAIYTADAMRRRIQGAN